MRETDRSEQHAPSYFRGHDRGSHVHEFHPLLLHPPPPPPLPPPPNTPPPAFLHPAWVRPGTDGGIKSVETEKTDAGSTDELQLPDRDINHKRAHATNTWCAAELRTVTSVPVQDPQFALLIPRTFNLCQRVRDLTCLQGEHFCAPYFWPVKHSSDSAGKYFCLCIAGP
ncbi:hypothetical protein BaRGS_00014072 [Batillaria attramentaria]|uniref:Uncharacterized protein n=1 Tax=Batillaria attramentaria TaxID=370345 RepID=A0ABD0L5J0_9CAEN